MKKIERILNSRNARTLKRILTLRGTNHFAPSSLAFFLALSLIPCLVLIEVFLSIVNLSFGLGLSVFQVFLPEESFVVSVKEIVENLGTGSLLSIAFSFGVITYLASKGITFFTRQVQEMYREQVEEKPFFQRKMRAIAITLLLLLLLSVLIAFIIAFNRIFSLGNKLTRAFFNYFLILLILFVFVVFLYRISSENHRNYRDLVWGSLFTTIGIGGGIFLYYLYLRYISSALSYYGPLSSLALLFLICYYSSYILFFGVEINIVVAEKRLNSRFTKKKKR